MKRAIVQTVSLKQWGNSLGLVIPIECVKAISAYPGETFRMTVKPDGSLVLKPVLALHEEWLEGFNQLADEKPEMLLSDAPTQFDEEEWTW